MTPRSCTVSLVWISSPEGVLYWPKGVTFAYPNVISKLRTLCDLHVVQVSFWKKFERTINKDWNGTHSDKDELQEHQALAPWWAAVSLRTISFFVNRHDADSLKLVLQAQNPQNRERNRARKTKGAIKFVPSGIVLPPCGWWYQSR